MKPNIYSTIIGTGSFIPSRKVPNDSFLDNQFYDEKGELLDRDNRYIVDKFKEITTIEERRYAEDDLVTSDLGYFAAKNALENSGIDPEELDYVIVAHNFGDVKKDSNRSDFVPSLAARIKARLKIKNPSAVCYDIAFGCPGWIQAVIQADYYIRSGDATTALVIGSEVLSRVSDPHDRDSMIYSDGAGAVVLRGASTGGQSGILGHASRSDALQYSHMLFMGESYNNTEGSNGDIFLKMNGRKLYHYALTHVPQAMKDCLDKCNISIDEVKKVLIHQANGKMDDAILKRFYALYGKDHSPELVMPMTISWLGNSSVATVPTLLDLILNHKMEDQHLSKGDIILMASVGAGMNINALVYKY